MAEERLTLLLRARGGRRTRRDVDDVGDSIDRVGRNMVRANRRASMFSRGLRLLQTRMAMMVIAGAALAVVLGPPLLGVMALLLAGTMALAGALAPLAILGIAVADRFEQMKDVAGTAAESLWEAAVMFREIFRTIMAGPAATIMRALAGALETLVPLLYELAPGFQLIADAAGFAITGFADALATMGPQLNLLFSQAGPFIAAMGPAMIAFTEAMIALGIFGIPVLTQLLHWLTQFLYWLGPAIAEANAFAHSAAFLGVVRDVWAGIATVAQYLAPIIADLAVIAWGVVSPFFATKEAGNELGAVMTWIAGAIDYVSKNMQIFGPILAGVIAGLIAFNVVAGITNAILMANPIVLIIAAVVGLGVALFLAYQRFQLVRDIVGVVWTILRNSPLAWLIRLVWRARGAFGAFANAIRVALGGALEWIRPKIAWLIDKLRWIADKAGGIANIAGDALSAVPGAGPALDVLGGLAGQRAQGGPVHRGGAYVVGEEGPELFRPSQSGTIIPNGEMGGDVVIHNRTYLDRKVIAESVHREAIRKKSTR